jgi:hypothetical protein
MSWVQEEHAAFATIPPTPFISPAHDAPSLAPPRVLAQAPAHTGRTDKLRLAGERGGLDQVFGGGLSAGATGLLRGTGRAGEAARGGEQR